MKRELVALVFGLALSAVVGAEAQQQSANDTAPAGTTAAPLPIPQPAPGFVQPKTPWGDPDIQGFWPGVEMVGTRELVSRADDWWSAWRQFFL